MWGGRQWKGGATAVVDPCNSVELSYLLCTQVAAARPRSARITGATDINSLLSDIGPGLWKSINPSYFSASDKLLVCTSHSMHRYNTKEGWDAPVCAGGPMRSLTPPAAALHREVLCPRSCLPRIDYPRAQVDRKHYLKMADCQQFANKCLELGEKPFLGGGMKLSGK
jgi:hypothetical protein